MPLHYPPPPSSPSAIGTIVTMSRKAVIRMKRKTCMPVTDWTALHYPLHPSSASDCRHQMGTFEDIPILSELLSNKMKINCAAHCWEAQHICGTIKEVSKTQHKFTKTQYTALTTAWTTHEQLCGLWAARTGFQTPKFLQFPEIRRRRWESAWLSLLKKWEGGEKHLLTPTFPHCD